jgi:hypothetical protein
LKTNETQKKGHAGLRAEIIAMLLKLRGIKDCQSPQKKARKDNDGALSIVFGGNMTLLAP